MISWGNVLPALSALLCACALRPVLASHFLGLNVGARSCTLYRTAVQGACQSIYDCPVILQNIHRFTPTVCFLQGRIPYVCCPTLSSATTDVSPPAISFSCGTSISKPTSRLLDEALVSKALDSFPALRASFPANADFAPRAARSPDPSVPFRLPPLTFRRFVTEGFDSKKNSWPWAALLGYGSKSSPRWDCDGVLINERWVLTAAHCVIREFASVVRLGEHDLSKSSESSHRDFGVSNTIFHKRYNYGQGYHDLALLRLDQQVTINNQIRPICLPWGKKPVPSVGSVLTLIGWGRTSFGGNRSSVLQEANIHMFDSQECANGYSTLPDFSFKYPRGITSDLLCIGDKDGKGRDACQGDSGGPVMYRDRGNYVLAGIVSKGYGCGNPDFPGIYASVHHAPDLAWIKQIAF